MSETVMDWRNIEVLALHDPILHAAVTRVRQGVVSREEALIAVVVALSERMAMLHGAKLDALYFGNGFVAVTHESCDGKFRYRRLDPASVTIHPASGDVKGATAVERDDAERANPRETDR